MRRRLIIRLALRTLLRRRTRTILTLLGVCIGILVVTAFLGIAEGLLQATGQTIHTGRTDITVFDAHTSADILSTLEEAEVRPGLEGIGGVGELSACLWTVLPSEKTPFLFIEGLRPGEFMLGTRTIVDGDPLRRADEILLGRGTARTLEVGVGDTVTVAKHSFRVAGLYETGVIYLDQAAIVFLDVLQALSKRPGVVTLFYVRTTPEADPAGVARRIEAANQDLVAVRSVEDYKKVDQGVRIIQGASWMISVLAIFVGVIGVMNTMWISVFERTREIGILRAVGWRQRQIMFAIGLESVLIAGLGGLLGIAGGMATARILARLPWAEQFLAPLFPARVLLWAAGVAVLTGIFGGLYPAYRASRLSPVEALRYE